MHKFKERFNELLKETSKTQKEISKAIGISQSHLSNLKSGYNEPNIEQLIKISQYFDVTIDYLVGIQEY